MVRGWDYRQSPKRLLNPAPGHAVLIELNGGQVSPVPTIMSPVRLLITASRSVSQFEVRQRSSKRKVHTCKPLPEPSCIGKTSVIPPVVLSHGGITEVY